MEFVKGKFFSLVTAVLAVLILCTAPVLAQTNYGSVRGLVKDPQGAVIPDSDVTLTNSGTKISRTSKSNAAGEYQFTSVAPGPYDVTVALTGFKTFKQGVMVELGGTATVDATLQVGSTAETIEVQTSEPLIDTASASAGQSFTSQQLTELPNLGRNPFVFEKLDNNVTPVGDPRYVRAEDQSGSSSVSIAGAPIGANSYVVDGIPVSTSSGGVTFIPSPEAVSDAKTQANTYDAEIGRTGGGVGNTSLKSGTSTYHGVLYGETRQTNWSANSWLNKHTPYLVNGAAVPGQPFTPRPDVTTYLYAGAFGGPVPFANKWRWTKDTFFFITEEGYRQAQPFTGSGQLIVPTAQEASGDFSGDVALAASTGASLTLYDPTSQFVNGKRTGLLTSTRCTGVALVGCIPQSYLNPIGSWIAGNAFPSPTNPAAAYGQYNSQRSDDFKTRSDMYSGKLDHTFAPWWSANVSYVHLATQEPSGDFYGNKGQYSSDGKLVRFNDATSFYNVFTLNPTTIATVGYGFNRYYSVTFAYGLGFNPLNGYGGAGLPASFVAADQSQFGGKYTFPAIYGTSTTSGVTQNSAGQYAPLGNSFGGRSIPSASHNFVLGIQKTVGKQNLKGGYVYRALHVAANPVGSNPGFGFTGNFTSADGKAASTEPSGNGLADLEMGLPDTAAIGQASGAFNEMASYHALYFQDDFRASDKLTVNLGLRYEYELGERELNNQLNVGFAPNITYTIPAVAVGSTMQGGGTLHGGLVYAGQNGAPIHTANQSHTKFSPRIGVAYEMRKGTVLQAGFGVFYGPEAVAAYNAGYTQSSSYTAGTGGIISSALSPSQVGVGAYLSNPFSGGANGSIIPPSGNTLGAQTALGSAIGSATSAGVVDFGRRDPLVEQYSLRIERQLPWATALTVGYAGAHAKNFPLTVNINQLPDGIMAQFAAAAAGGATTSYSTTAASNPYYIPTVSNGTTRYATGSITSNTSIAAGQLLLPYPQYSTIGVSQSVGYSLYNALNVKVQKRASRGLTVLFTYTLMSNWDNLYNGGSTLNSSSGPQDNYNLKGEYSRAVNDIPNRFAAGITYELPVGRGQQFFSGMPRYLDYLVGGYKVNAIVTRQDGGPLNITQGTNESSTYGVSGFGGNSIRPNFSGTNPCYSGSPESRIDAAGNVMYFNPAGFTGARAFTYGNVPRQISCKGPGLSSTDINVNKDFKIGERVTIRFIAEALNITNTPQFAITSTSLPVNSKSVTSPSGVPTFAPVEKTTGALNQINYNRFIQLGGRIFF